MEKERIIAGDLLTIEGKKYITLETLTYENNNYAFVNQMTDDEEATEDFYIFKIFDDGIRIVVEETLKNTLLPKFQELLQKDMNELLK